MKSPDHDPAPRVHSLGATLVLTCTKGNVAGSDAYMSYRLVVVCPRSKAWWILNRRYSHFYALRQRLKEFATAGHAALKTVVGAAFPRRRFVFAVDNKSVVDERLRGLPAFTAELARWLPVAEPSGAYGPSYLAATFLQLPYRRSAAPAKAPHDIFGVANSAMSALHAKVLGNDAKDLGARPPTPVASKSITPTATSAYYMSSGLTTDLMAHVVQYLDGVSIGRLQQTCHFWHAELDRYDAPVWRRLLATEFLIVHPPSTMPSVLSYIAARQDRLDAELRHTQSIAAQSSALEAYTATEANHGIVDVFCDMCYFEDPLVGIAIAKQRFGAMAMVVVETADHVRRFRKRSTHVGPINFVPLQNPHWPSIELPAMDGVDGCLGYAFDLVQMAPGHDMALKDTVVRAILKNIAVFETRAQATTFQNAMPQHVPTVALDDPGAPFELCFASPLRQHFAQYTTRDKIDRLRRLKAACETSHAAVYARRYP
ncbi:hypothetical protein SPRG_03717 [Saprolegnia parasitica CBS 223.65]|uniref:PX domain-containing protein n=1 Tax=Saprolegnia parasitica (strain CBS 223.65) TaxID=695850 RepID=A0A067CYC3_SAPPC|nr:hypothetical protein SPRG_03717 [Saprolegnia parasitica CBS 223.65]KDO31797.1 hypothetical protein SPRG_03717 [Saprolegnia parasitica CBS 223.65]|eukprot:XP_012197677.1 hypothetical protein SPRG_03717 [Saprolegnia parasitica CBS 223.65]